MMFACACQGCVRIDRCECSITDSELCWCGCGCVCVGVWDYRRGSASLACQGFVSLSFCGCGRNGG